MKSTPMADRLRLLSTLFLLVAVIAASGCKLTRDSGSRYIAAPYDTESRKAREGAQAAIQDPEIVMAQSGEYYIGPGDELAITLVGRDDIFGRDKEGESKLLITITENPMITLPLIGAIKAHGKTAEQLRQQLEDAYGEYIVNPIPIVQITKFHYNQVSVLGSVNEPGKYPLEFGDTVLDLVYKAGGLTLGRGTPPARYMKIYREKATREDRADIPLEELLEMLKEGDKIQPRSEIILPIEDLILSGNLDYNIPLRPNDIVYIPTAGTVIIQGRVKTPGVVFLGPSLRTVSQVITERGGLRFGAASTVEVVRTNPDGSSVAYFLDSRKIMKRKTEDLYLQDNDQIFVHTHPVRATLEFLGQIFRATAATGVNATYNPI